MNSTLKRQNMLATRASYFKYMKNRERRGIQNIVF